MNPELPHIGDLSDERSSVIKQIRASFESGLQSSSTRIEDWLSTVSGHERLALLVELLDAEIQYLQQQDRILNIDDYKLRFPDELQIVHAVFVHHGLVSNSAEDDPLYASTKKIVSPEGHINAPNDWTAGDFAGRYRLVDLIGCGGFGQVWKAFDPELQRYVAVKLSRKRWGLRSSVASAFHEEARRAASLRDPGIVPVYDIGKTEHGTFIVSEFIDGPTLAQRMKASQIPVDEAIRIVIHTATTLHHAHMAGLVHRDVKPSNILLRSDGTPAITDFGLAVSEAEQLEEKSHVGGTLVYMSPEQARGESRHVDGRSDLYSLGVILFQLLTGRHPFQYRNSAELLEQILHREVRPLRSIDDRIPAELERICLRCLSKDIKQRYLTGVDLAADLQEYLARQNRKPMRVLGGMISIVVVLAAAWTVSSGFVRPKDSGKVSAGPQVPGIETPITVKLGQWHDMLDQNVEQLTTIEGDSLDFFRHDVAEKSLTLRSERNPWLIATSLRGATPVRIRGTVSLDDWIGNVGFFWGLDDLTPASRRKSLVCYALTIERYQPTDSLKLALLQLTVGESISSVTYIRHSSELAFTEISMPAGPDAALEVYVVDGRVEVGIDGLTVWTAVSKDPVAEAAMKTREGLVGFVGRGKTVMFCDTAVMFEVSKKKEK